MASKNREKIEWEIRERKNNVKVASENQEKVDWESRERKWIEKIEIEYRVR